MTDLDVQADVLHAHASRLRASADQFDSAGAAALHAVALQPEAFGLLCSFLVPVVTLQQTTTVGALGALRLALEAEATAVAAAGTTYALLDDHLAAEIARVI